MRMSIVGVVAVFAASAYSLAAWAKCPSGTRYECYTISNGKQACGCRNVDEGSADADTAWAAVLLLGPILPSGANWKVG